MKITCRQLRQIIKEELNFLPKRNNIILLEAGSKHVQVELANSPHARNQGLMYRTILGEDCGMLFAFPDLSMRSFWMKNTALPLSIAFINESGIITNIEDMTPFSIDNIYSECPVNFALEMKQGWFQENHIVPGDLIKGLPDIPTY